MLNLPSGGQAGHQWSAIARPVKLSPLQDILSEQVTQRRQSFPGPNNLPMMLGIIEKSKP